MRNGFSFDNEIKFRRKKEAPSLSLMRIAAFY